MLTRCLPTPVSLALKSLAYFPMKTSWLVVLLQMCKTLQNYRKTLSPSKTILQISNKTLLPFKTLLQSQRYYKSLRRKVLKPGGFQSAADLLPCVRKQPPASCAPPPSKKSRFVSPMISSSNNTTAPTTTTTTTSCMQGLDEKLVECIKSEIMVSATRSVAWDDIAGTILFFHAFTGLVDAKNALGISLSISNILPAECLINPLLRPVSCYCPLIYTSGSIQGSAKNTKGIASIWPPWNWKEHDCKPLAA